jgi:hypothetical protein
VTLAERFQPRRTEMKKYVVAGSAALLTIVLAVAPATASFAGVASGSRACGPDSKVAIVVDDPTWSSITVWQLGSNTVVANAGFGAGRHTLYTNLRSARWQIGGSAAYPYSSSYCYAAS